MKSTKCFSPLLTAEVTLDAYEYWELIAELAVLMEDRDLEKYCYRGMIAVFPDKSKVENMAKLKVMRS